MAEAGWGDGGDGGCKGGVRGFDGILARCAELGVTPFKTFPEELNGRFAHIMDPEGGRWSCGSRSRCDGLLNV